MAYYPSQQPMAYAQPMSTTMSQSYLHAQPQPQPMMMAQHQPMMMAQPAYAQPAYAQHQPMMMMAQPQPVRMAMPQPMMAMQQTGKKAPHPTGGQPIPDDACNVPLTGKVHMLCTGIDYACDHQSWAGPPPLGHGPLDTKYAFNMMVDLAQKSGVTSLTQLWNQQCTKDNICNHIIDVGRRCLPGDVFIFYYTGHGDQLPNTDPNDPEQSDQCLCTVDAAGNTDDQQMQYRQQVWLRDDALAAAIQSAVIPQAHSLILVDACHSGSICDFASNPKWAQKGLQALSISGCADNQTSAGTGKGGVYTRALTLALQEMQQQHGHTSFNVACIYNSTLKKYQQTNPPGHEQNISIHGCGVAASKVAWPLQPQGPYVSPVNQPLQPQAQTYAAPSPQFSTYAAPPAHYAAPLQMAHHQPMYTQQQPMYTSLPTAASMIAYPPANAGSMIAPTPAAAAAGQTYAAPAAPAKPATAVSTKKSKKASKKASKKKKGCC